MFQLRDTRWERFVDNAIERGVPFVLLLGPACWINALVLWLLGIA